MSAESNKKPKKKLKIDRKKVITIVVVVVVLVVVLLLGVLVRWLQDKDKEESGGAEVIGLLENPFPQDVLEAQELNSQGDYDGANATIEEGLNETSDDSVKYELYLQQGLNYENQEKYDEAIKSYQDAEAISATYTVYESIGRVAELKGDSQLAIDNYKKAYETIDTDYPMADADKSDLESRIKDLGGSL
jgi:tetratricopeptide (TPR) repeat protein